MAEQTSRAERAPHGALPAADEHAGENIPINPQIEQITRWLALVGGALMCLAIVITLISVVGRYLFNAPLPGDYESVEMIAAVGIFLFFPYTHATGSNIVVRFFTSGMSGRRKLLLDMLHDVIFTTIAVLLAWRLSIGFADKFASGESTMLIRLPYWWSFGFAVLSMILLAVVCIARLVSGFRILRQ